MSKVLVLGGTRFFGRRLVEQLIREGADVTILTRGNQADPFGDTVTRLQADRTDRAALRNALGETTYDVVYDNIMFTPQEAEEAVELFAGRTNKFIVTSTLAVYPFGDSPKTEGDFDPYTYNLPESYPPKVDYGLGKQLVEAVLFQKAPFAVAAVRFPIVLGLDDYTRRLHFHIEHVQQDLPLGIPHPEALLSFIRSDEAASFLAWLGRSSLEGPVNASSYGEISTGEIVSLISQATGKQAVLLPETDKEHRSPFALPGSWYMDASKAESAGFEFLQLRDWLPKLIQEIAST